MVNSVSDEDVDEKVNKKTKEKRQQKSPISCPECGNPADELDAGRAIYIVCQIKECGYRGKK
jgi:hypothetical protein